MKVQTATVRLATPGEAVEDVSGVVHRPVRPSRPAVLLVPGAGGDLDSAGLVALASSIAAAGHMVVRANLPYREAGRRGAPRADRSVAGFVKLAQSARAQLAPRTPWVLGGKSYGGRVASMAVAGGLVEAAGMIFYGYPLHPPGKPDQLRVDHWPDIKVPCLFLQGDRDTFATGTLLRDNLSKLPRRARLELVQGGDHSLKVTGKHAADGKPRSAKKVMSTMGPTVDRWLTDILT